MLQNYFHNQVYNVTVKYLRHIDIDKKKWDNCIARSCNGLIYSTSVYLDCMATHWDGLIMDDYAAVMPLPFRKKYGFHYVYPPAFSQQMGITSLHEITIEVIAAFLKNIPAKFSYVEMNFNVYNLYQYENEKERLNYILPLNSSFETIKKNFSRSALRNIKKAQNEKIIVRENVTFTEIINIHRSRFNDAVGANAADYNRLATLFYELQKTNLIFTTGAYDPKGTLIGGSIYFVFKNRITFIINGNTPESLKNGATHLLMYETIKKFSNTGSILDFEGSDFPEFARFYQQYGSTAEMYKLVKINKLPWPFSLLKR